MRPVPLDVRFEVMAGPRTWEQSCPFGAGQSHVAISLGHQSRCGLRPVGRDADALLADLTHRFVALILTMPVTLTLVALLPKQMWAG